MLAISTEGHDGPLAFAISSDGTTRTISLSGELDLANIETLARTVESCEVDGIAKIVLDLDALEFIDSSGIVLLLTVHARLNKQANGDGSTGPCLRIVPSRAIGVRRVLAITGVDGVLPLLDATEQPE